MPLGELVSRPGNSACLSMHHLWGCESMAWVDSEALGLALGSVSFCFWVCLRSSHHRCFQPVLIHTHMLWELMLLGEPLVVLTPAPAVASEVVLALTR